MAFTTTTKLVSVSGAGFPGIPPAHRLSRPAAAAAAGPLPPPVGHTLSDTQTHPAHGAMVTDPRTGHAAANPANPAPVPVSDLIFDPPSVRITLSFHPGGAAASNYTAAMGLAYNVYLNSAHIYGCKTCKTHLSNREDIISRVSPCLWLPLER